MRLYILTIFLILNGCASHSVVPARLYNLSDGTNFTVQLTNFQNGFGRATAELNSGEKFEGEYTLKAQHISRYPIQMQTLSNAQSAIGENTRKSSVPSKDEVSWAEVYGFSAEAQATPVGTGTLIGSKGTIIHIVFYTADFYRKVGDGVARSNKGKWYRFHVGLLDLK